MTDKTTTQKTNTELTQDEQQVKLVKNVAELSQVNRKLTAKINVLLQIIGQQASATADQVAEQQSNNVN